MQIAATHPELGTATGLFGYVLVHRNTNSANITTVFNAYRAFFTGSIDLTGSTDLTAQDAWDELGNGNVSTIPVRSTVIQLLYDSDIEETERNACLLAQGVMRRLLDEYPGSFRL